MHALIMITINMFTCPTGGLMNMMNKANLSQYFLFTFYLHMCQKECSLMC